MQIKLNFKILIFFLLCGLLHACKPVQANSIAVPGDYPTIQSAIASAQDGSTIVIASGQYFEHLVISNKSITLQGDATGRTVLDGFNSGSVIWVGEKAHLTLQDLVIRRGFATHGGAIQIERGKLIGKNLEIYGNTASIGGGAILNLLGTLELSNSVIRGNLSTGTIAGAIFNSGALKLSQVTFTENGFSTPNETNSGGAIYSGQNTTLTIENSIFEYNQGEVGGAILADGMLDIQDTLFRQNSAHLGAAIFIKNSTEAQVNWKNLTFENNLAKQDGGAVYADKAQIRIEQSTFKQNSAKNGGAIAARASIINGADITFQQNNAEERGGAIFAQDGELHFAKSQWQDNTALFIGGAIYDYSAKLDIQNSAFLDNTAENAGGAIHQHKGISILMQVRFLNNKSNAKGGAILLSRGELQGLNLLFEQNFAKESGGALYAYLSNTELAFSSLLNNLAPNGADLAIAGQELRVSQSIIAGEVESCVVSNQASIQLQNTITAQSICGLQGIPSNRLIVEKLSSAVKTIQLDGSFFTDQACPAIDVYGNIRSKTQCLIGAIEYLQ